MRIAVVGGGVIGCAIARELAKNGAFVEIFEPRGIGAGASQASAGALVPLVEAHEQGSLQQLALRSLSMYDEFVETIRSDSGMPIDFERCGSLEVAITSREAAALRESIPEIDGVRWLEATQVYAQFPQLTPGVSGGLLVPFHGYVSARELVAALAVAAERYGVTIRRARVRDIRSSAEGATLSTADAQVYAFDRIVLAAGAWTSALQAPLSPPVRPVKGQLLALACRNAHIPQILWSSLCYVVPQVSGEVLVGATMEEAGFDEQPTTEAAAALLGGFRRLFPAADVSVLDHRVGLRPATPDELPVVGPAGADPTVIYAAGHFRNGIILAPLTAKVVSDLLLTGVQDAALGSLAPSRFGL